MYKKNILYFQTLLTILVFLASGCQILNLTPNSTTVNQTTNNSAVKNPTSTPVAKPSIDNSAFIGKYRGIDILPDTVGEFHNLGDDSKQVGRRWATFGRGGNEYYHGADEIFAANYGKQREKEVFVEVVKYSNQAKAKKDYDELTTMNESRGRKLLSKKPLLAGIEYAEIDSGIQYTYALLGDFIVTFWGNKREQFNPFIEALKNSKIAQDATSK